MSGGICPGDFVPGIMSEEFCLGDIVREILSGVTVRGIASGDLFPGECVLDTWYTYGDKIENYEQRTLSA